MDLPRHFSGVDLGGDSFAGEDLTEAIFEKCRLAGTNFRGALLNGARFTSCVAFCPDSGASVDFSFAELREALFVRCDLTAAEFANISAYDLSLENCQLQGTNFSAADFRLPIGSRSDLAGFTMTNCNFAYGDLSNTCLHGCQLTGNRMVEALLHNTVLDEANLCGSDLCNISAQGVSLRGADLRGAQFNNLDLREIDVSGVHISLEQTLQLLEPLGLQISTDGN